MISAIKGAVATVLATLVTCTLAVGACAQNGEASFSDSDAGAEAAPPSGLLPTEAGSEAAAATETRDPVDCEEAKTSKSYVGCDYWPTVTPNSVWSIFDFAVAVANTGTQAATVTVSGPGFPDAQVTVPAGELRTINLPWVPALKGEDSTECGSSTTSLLNSVVVPRGAYHLVSSSPVIAYQFSPIEYKGEGGTGPDGGAKDWSSCPGLSCATGPIACLSYSNDASLLLPSTAMTNNYRVTGYKGVPKPIPSASFPGLSVALSITATQPNTSVTLTLSSLATVLPSVTGQPIPETTSGKLVFSLANAGDVAQIVSGNGDDFSGSLVQSDKPVQVITAIPCITIPQAANACDHIEETVLPAEALGKDYVVVQPTGPKKQPVGQLVRLYGNQDGTALTYFPTKPPKCPDTISAGEMVDCDISSTSFEVKGTKEFGVSTFLLGSTVYGDPKGDPSQSNVAAVEQFRTKYVFLAPSDYPVLYADITAPEDAQIELDGSPIVEPWVRIGNGPWGVHRADLTRSGQRGAHTLTSKKAVGVQVIGFGDSTSFQYPAGLNLDLIAPPPPPPK